MIPTPGQTVYFVTYEGDQLTLALGVVVREMTTNIRTWKVLTTAGTREVHQDHLHESRALALQVWRLDEETQAAELVRASEDARRSLATWDAAIERHNARARWAADELAKEGEPGPKCASGGCDLESGASCGHCAPTETGPREADASFDYRSFVEGL